jgi:hypothetical protein
VTGLEESIVICFVALLAALVAVAWFNRKPK